jgi:hypothetical protein
MKTKLLLFSLLFNLLLVIAACGGAGKSVSTAVNNKLHAFVGAMPGFHGLTATKTTAFEFSITPKLYAQTTTTVSFTGSYSGFCPSLNAASGAASLFYGSGTLDALACGTTSFAGNPDNALTAAQNAGGAQLVIGNGTLGPLVAYADSSTATVRVYVNRSGQTLDTGISVTLDANSKRGTSTATFPVLDGDTIAVVAVSDGTPSKNLQFVLAKE